AGNYRLIVTASPKRQPSGAYTLTVRAATERERLEAKARALNEEAARRYGQGAYAAAARLWREAVGLWREGDPPKQYPHGHPALATTLSNRGTALEVHGHLDEARSCHEQALAIQQKALPPDHPALAATLNNLGMVLWLEGKLDEARARLGQALAIFQKA